MLSFPHDISLSLSIGENFIVFMSKLLSCFALISGVFPEDMPVISHIITVILDFMSVPTVTTYRLSALMFTAMRFCIFPKEHSNQGWTTCYFISLN